MIVVVGSGPAGVACASALLDRGHPVTMVDAGIELEPERRARLAELAALPAERWPAETLAALHSPAQASLRGVPVKYAYGSDFPYRGAERALPFELVDVDTRPSLARGGLSRVWGAAVLPHREEDMDAWPLAAGELDPHYRAVARWMPVAGVQDDLEALFPIHGERGAALEPSRQAQAMLARMARGRERLRAAGVHFGRARLAVRAEARAGRPGCVYCARCLVGCPYGLIWDSTAVLDALAARPGFRYAGGLVAERVRELPGEVALDVRGTDGAAREPLRAERVFLACGVVSTTRLLLASRGAFDRPTRMLDSQYFLLPLLHLRGVGDPQREALHTLAQLFIEIRDPRVSARNVHLQVYGYNDMYRDLLERLAGPLRRVLGAPTRALLSRLSIVQGYLHSDDSRSIRVTLRRGEAAPRLVLEAESNPATRRTLHRVVAKLARHARDLGALPLWPLIQVAPPGRGFHSGGTFPMRATPGPSESDVLGRPHGFERVHAVDSSVLPSIPSTTITFSVMANAHRIGSATELL